MELRSGLFHMHGLVITESIGFEGEVKTKILKAMTTDDIYIASMVVEMFKNSQGSDWLLPMLDSQWTITKYSTQKDQITFQISTGSSLIELSMTPLKTTMIKEEKTSETNSILDLISKRICAKITVDESGITMKPKGNGCQPEKVSIELEEWMQTISSDKMRHSHKFENENIMKQEEL